MRFNSISTGAVTALLCTFLCGVPAVSAKPLAKAEAVPRLDTVVVTATRTAVMADDVIAPVTVISRDQIERSTAQTLPELLANEGGLSVVTNGGRGKVSSVFMRGTNSGHVLFLIDGVRMQSATLGTYAFEHIPVEQIERIEIVRGGRSGLYGADAVGGVVQIFTRRGQAGETAVQVAVGFGNEGTRNISASVSGDSPVGRFSLRATHEQTDGYDVSTLPTTHPDNDGYRNHSFGASWDYDISADTSVGVTGLTLKGKNEIDNPWAAVPTPDDVDTSKQHLLAAHINHQFRPDWETRFAVEYSKDDYISESDLGRQSQFETGRLGLKWTNRFSPSATQEWLFGVERIKEDVAGMSVATYTKTERTTNGLFGQWFAQWGAVSTQAVARYDALPEGQKEWTGNLEAALPLTDALRLSAGVNRAFKQPSMNDLYYVDAWGSDGNPNLLPERANGAEINLTLNQENYSGRVGVFAQRIEQLIQWLELPPGSWSYTPVNVAEAKIHGLEMEFHAQLRGVRLDLSGTLLKAEDSDTGLRLARRAASEFRARVSGALPWVGSAARPLEGLLEVTYTGERYDDAAETVRLSDYVLWHTGLRYRLDQSWRLALDVRNLFDQQTDAVKDYPMPGRQISVGVRFDF